VDRYWGHAEISRRFFSFKRTHGHGRSSVGQHRCLARAWKCNNDGTTSQIRLACTSAGCSYSRWMASLFSGLLPCNRLCAFAVVSVVQILCASPTEVTPLPTPTTLVAKQKRTALKHRDPPVHYSATQATVGRIMALNQRLPAGVNTSASIRASNTPISPYETQVFRVDGDLWRVKMEGNDNEYHLEISRRGEI